jgi:hypothetical protein
MTKIMLEPYGVNKDEAVGAFKRVLDEVLHTERTNTRNAGTDWRCRELFVDHGNYLLALLERNMHRT